ncbi:MAG: hypothetical protein ORN50_02290, partial [Crocinitomicaceae bacterium]|nr:hypothetical protein [Crocinitomicaceae bacterium]
LKSGTLRLTKSTKGTVNSKSVTLDEDDVVCSKYGFKTGSEQFSVCKLQLSQTRIQMEQQQKQYEEQKKLYEEQQTKYEKDRKFQNFQRIYDMGSRLVNGQSIVDVGRAGVGLSPLTPPSSPNPNQTVVLPNGQVINCNVTGSVTSCN